MHTSHLYLGESTQLCLGVKTDHEFLRFGVWSVAELESLVSCAHIGVHVELLVGVYGGNLQGELMMFVSVSCNS